MSGLTNAFTNAPTLILKDSLIGGDISQTAGDDFLLNINSKLFGKVALSNGNDTFVLDENTRDFTLSGRITPDYLFTDNLYIYTPPVAIIVASGLNRVKANLVLSLPMVVIPTRLPMSPMAPLTPLTSIRSWPMAASRKPHCASETPAEVTAADFAIPLHLCQWLSGRLCPAGTVQRHRAGQYAAGRRLAPDARPRHHPFGVPAAQRRSLGGSGHTTAGLSPW